MKRILALLVALLAMVSGSMALTAVMPDWVEEMGAGETYTYGDYSTLKAISEDSFTPQTLTSELTFDTDGVSADIEQTVATSIVGDSEGITRQVLAQEASASVATGSPLEIDTQNNGAATTLVMNIAKDQTALFSGKLVSTAVGEVVSGYDAPFDNIDGVDQVDGSKTFYVPGYGWPLPADWAGHDDAYGGGHEVSWIEVNGNPAAWTATFDDTASLTATDANEESVTLNQAVEGATVTVSANPSGADVPSQYFITDDDCVGYGDLWNLASDGTQTLAADGNAENLQFLDPADYSGGSAEIIEAAASVSSDLTLTDSEVEILGEKFNFRTLDGSFGLDGAFGDAITTAGSSINIDLDGDMDAWWS